MKFATDKIKDPGLRRYLRKNGKCFAEFLADTAVKVHD